MGEVIHGDARRGNFTQLYNSWRGMKGRCNNKKNKRYSNYGGRGIVVCEEWNEFINFKEWALNNGYQPGLTIERIDVNGNYEPSNCCWATNKEQANNKTNNHFLSFDGETLTINQWAEKLNIQRGVIKDRLRWGWSVEDALTTPVAKCERHDSYEYDGETHTLKEWAEIKKIKYETLHWRLCRRGWDIEKALSEPVQKHNN